MDIDAKRDARLVNIAGVLGSMFARLALGEILLLFVTQCLMIPKEDWALVQSVIPLTAAFQLLSAYLAEHYRRRKALSLGCFAVSRLAVPAIVLLPFITGKSDRTFQLYYMAVALISLYAISGVGESSWLSWIADIVPQEQRGWFLSTRYKWTTAFGLAAGFCASRLVDVVGPANRWSYLITFGVAFIVGELDLIIHARVADRPMPETEERARLVTLLAAPWRDSGFRNLMLQRMIVAFGDSCVGPFAYMYLFEDLHLSVTHLFLLTATFEICGALSLDFWRRTGERIGYRTVYLITHTLYGLGIIYWWFLPRDQFYLLMLILLAARVYLGFAYGGLMLAVGTLNLNTAPEKHRSTYFAQVMVMISLSSALGIFFGRWIFLHTNPLTEVNYWGTKLTGAHVLIGLFGLFRLLTIRVFFNKIPDPKSEVAMPRLSRILQANPLRIVPALMELPPPLSAERRAEHVTEVIQQMPTHQRERLEEAIRQVLRDRVSAEDEFYSVVGRERLSRGRGLARLTDELATLAAHHMRPSRARAVARHIQRLYEEGEHAACSRIVQRLARRAAARLPSPVAESARSVIDALAEPVRHREELSDVAVLLAVYACLQILREPHERR